MVVEDLTELDAAVLENSGLLEPDDTAELGALMDTELLAAGKDSSKELDDLTELDTAVDVETFVYREVWAALDDVAVLEPEMEAKTFVEEYLSNTTAVESFVEEG